MEAVYSQVTLGLRIQFFPGYQIDWSPLTNVYKLRSLDDRAEEAGVKDLVWWKTPHPNTHPRVELYPTQDQPNPRPARAELNAPGVVLYRSGQAVACNHDDLTTVVMMSEGGGVVLALRLLPLLPMQGRKAGMVAVAQNECVVNDAFARHGETWGHDVRNLRALIIPPVNAGDPFKGGLLLQTQQQLASHGLSRDQLLWPERALRPGFGAGLLIIARQ